MIKRVDRYIGKAAVQGILAVWLVMVILAVMFGLLAQLRGTEAGYTSMDALWFVLMTAPRIAYQVFPVCALIGALVGVGGLAAGNELVAFRTSGVSRLRLAGAALAGTLLISLPVMAMQEWLAPELEQRARMFRLSELIGQYIIGGPRGMWLRDGELIVNIREPLVTADGDRQSVQFGNVYIYDFGSEGSLREILHAGRATHDGEHWTLENVFVTDLEGEEIRRDFQGERPWQSRLEPEMVDSAVTRPPFMSMRSLFRQIGYMRANGLDDRIYLSALYAKVFYPVSLLALVLAGMPFVFGSARNQKLGVRLFIGMTVGVIFTLVNRVIQNLGEAYELSVLFTSLAPSLLLAFAAFLVLRRSA